MCNPCLSCSRPTVFRENEPYSDSPSSGTSPGQSEERGRCHLKSRSEAGTEEKQPGTHRGGSGGFWFSGGGARSSLQPMLFSALRLLPRVTGPERELASCSRLEIIVCSPAVKAITTCFYKDLYPEVLKMTSAEDFSLCEYSIWRHKVLISSCGFWFTF